MLELALRSTAILAAAWALARVLPRATAATRHLIWHGALVASLLAPFAMLAPVPRVPVVPQMLAAEVPHLPQVPRLSEALDTRTANRSRTPGTSLTAATTSDALRTLITLGAAASSLWFALGWLSAARLVRRARPGPLDWQLELHALCERLRIGREVRLGIINDQGSPLATGLFRPAILLPQTAMLWTSDRRRAVLIHELAHIKRRDCRVQLVAQAACALYWFNPLVWMAVAQLRRERERACDDEVLRLGAQASGYATHLLDIARNLRPALCPSAALAMARRSEFEGRLLAILATGRARVPARGTRWAIVGVLSVTTIVALGATTRTVQEPTSAVARSDAPYVVADDVFMSAEPQPEPRANAENTLRESPDPQDREQATLALAFTSGRDVIPALLKALADRDGQVREKAAIGLALRRDERVVQPLLDAMRDPDSQVREKVAIALGTTGDPRARDVLTHALNDPDSQVREKAAAALVLFSLTK
jgi:beta-lactamase regulating signal transducer with metallopeptidase domain